LGRPGEGTSIALGDDQRLLEPVGEGCIHPEADHGPKVVCSGSRTKLRRLLTDPKVSTVVVEHRDRLARMNAELVEAALSAHDRRLVVIDESEVDDDLVRDKTRGQPHLRHKPDRPKEAPR